MSFVKLDSGLIHSTVWRESAATRVVWITLLAMADKYGEVSASVPGLADVARVSLAEAETALTSFLAPDPYSRTKEHDGRRIEPIPGGWSLLNYGMYRERESEEDRKARGAARSKRYRDRHRNATPDPDSAETSSRDASRRNVTRHVISPKQKQRQKQRQKAEAVPQKTTTTDTPPKATYISGETPASPAQRPAPSAVAAVSKSARGKDGKPARLTLADLPAVKPPAPHP